MHVQRNRSWRGGVKKKKGKGGKKEIERKGAIHTCIACSKNFCHVIKAVKFWPLLLLLLQNSFHPASGTCLLLAFPFVVFWWWKLLCFSHQARKWKRASRWLCQRKVVNFKFQERWELFHRYGWVAEFILTTDFDDLPNGLPNNVARAFLCTLGTLKDLGQRQTFHLMAYSGRLLRPPVGCRPWAWWFFTIKKLPQGRKNIFSTHTHTHTHQPTEAHTHKSKQHFPALAALISLCLIPAFYYYYFFGWV